MQLARRELQRLQERGERAFLVNRGQYTMVYVGPFGSRDNAREKLPQLRSRYQDCFVKTL
jgi:cell division septation protein DedD